MRLLYISHSFPLPDRPLSNVGGMQRVAVDLQRALAARGDVELTTLALETDARWTGIRTVGFLGSLLRDVPRIVEVERIDAILFSSMVTAAIACPLADRIRRAGAIMAAIPVGRDLTLANPIYQRFVPRVLARLDLILPISRATAEEAMRRGAEPDRVHVVPCGVDLPPGADLPDRAVARNELLRQLRQAGHDVAEDAFLLLSVGRHQKRKGFHWFVEQVVPRLPRRAVYLLAGTGPMTGTIRRLVEESGLADRVLLLGQVPDDLLATLYRGSDLFIMPNIPVPGDMEGFGVVMIEAGAAGLPVVAADLEGIRDVITPERNGRLVPSGNVEAFLREIERYADAGVRAEESERAATHVRACFGWDGIAERHVTLLRERLRSAGDQPQHAPQNREKAAEHLGDQPQDDRSKDEAQDHATAPRRSTA